MPPGESTRTTSAAMSFASLESAVKAVEESANTIYVVVPHAVAAGAELDDADLEKVAGGATVKGDANCGDSDGMMNTVVEINASLI